MILTLIPPGRFSRRLNRRQQKRDQDANDRNHHQKLDKRKPKSRVDTFRITVFHTNSAKDEKRLRQNRITPRVYPIPTGQTWPAEYLSSLTFLCALGPLREMFFPQ